MSLQTPRPGHDTLDSAIVAEYAAYSAMRELVPDLALPLAQRRPLSRRQQSAVDDYADAHRRLLVARSVHADPAVRLSRTG